MDRKPIDCDEARTMVQRLLDRSLPAPEAALLATHVGACAGCAEALAGARALSSAMLGLRRVAPPAGFSERVLAAARASRPAPARLPMRIPVSALGLAAAATFFWFWEPTRRVIAALLVAGTERGADETVDFARSVGIVTASLAPLAGRLIAPLSPVFPALAALVRAIATALIHFGAENGVLAIGLLAGLAAAALAGDRAVSRPRRGFHVFSF